MRRFAFALTFVVALFGIAASAGAVIIDPALTSATPVEYKSNEQGNYVGVALVPETRSQLETAHIPTVVSKKPCEDPALAPDLKRPEMRESGLCYHGGPVMHGNETFVIVWDPLRRYFATTKEVAERFLRDVADSSGTLTSPYAITPQYTDGSGRAGNNSLYGGACDDFGVHGGSACSLSSSLLSGHEYSPAKGCPVTGTNDFYQAEPRPEPQPIFEEHPNDVCLTDAQIKSEITTMVEQTGIIGRTQPGYTPLLVLLTPTGVETCLNADGKLCSANGESTAQFCSYHSRLNVGGTEVNYVVQPWTAMTACDEPDAPVIELTGKTFEPEALETNLGEQLVSPLSQSHIAAIVNPEMSGWFALDGSEIDDNGCIPLSNGLDSATIAGKSYVLRREFNNGWLLVTDPYVYRCAPEVVFEPKFVVPSAMDAGKVAEFDGSVSPSTLVVPAAGYAWEFGDGTKAVGPSVEHTYAKGGVYPVTLTLTDRGGNVATITQAIDVIGPPVNTAAPAISDTTSQSPSNVFVGDVLEASAGSWNGYPTSYTYTYQWQDCDASGGSCRAIDGATAATYTPIAADVGHTLRVDVSASNTVGSGTATSQQSAVVSVLAPPMPTGGLSAGSIANAFQSTSGPPGRLAVRLALVPESLKALLAHGVVLMATANQAADGFTSIAITRSEAKHAHILYRRSASEVVIGRGTVKGLLSGTIDLHLRLSSTVRAKLKRLRRVVLTIQLTALDSKGERQTVRVTGRY